MHKWYENQACDSGVVLASQVCLLRSIDGFPFGEKIDDDEQEMLADRVTEAAFAAGEPLGLYFGIRELKESRKKERASLIGQLTIPAMMLGTSSAPRLLTTEDDAVSILIGGTEHVCIQVSWPGLHLQEAYDMARFLDDGINEKMGYSYSSQYGYLTASPLYTGTGLVSSCLLHLPYTEKGGELERFVKEAKDAGYSLSAHFHGKMQAPGEVYRLKNTRTIGVSEHEILAGLTALANRVSEREHEIWEKLSHKERMLEIDQMYRSYGLLKYARDLGGEETLEYLSSMRSAYLHRVWASDRRPPLFAMMLGSQKNVLKAGAVRGDVHTHSLRAAKIRDLLQPIHESDWEEL